MLSERSGIVRFLTHHVIIAAAVAATVLGLAAPAGAVAAGTHGTGVTESAAARPTIRMGDRGAAVTYLQQRLTALRYDVGGVDGKFGSNTPHGVYASRTGPWSGAGSMTNWPG
ncbi:peptidoglycan-binding protein [Actinoplanes sp. NPDC049265]|uniref:peptidoglycan-binding domain-containing protein n=1 Tax=Actinoplanes sp. NPDC049265 TaxID=3363902 RepID=UPI003717519D